MKNSYCTIYIVRHGESEANVKQILQGHMNTKLTKQGEAQAREAGKKLKKIHFDAVFSSDLIRAKRTAEIIMLEKRIAVKTTKVLRERSFGRFEGKNYQKFHDETKNLRKAIEKLTDEQRFISKLKEDVESDEELMIRLIPFLREIAVAYAGKTVLMASHGGIMRALLIHLGFGDYNNLSIRAVKNLGFIKLSSDGVDFFIKETWNIEKRDDIG